MSGFWRILFEKLADVGLYLLVYLLLTSYREPERVGLALVIVFGGRGLGGRS